MRKLNIINLVDDKFYSDSYLGNVDVEFNKLTNEVEKIFTDIDHPEKFQGFKNDERIIILAYNSIFQYSKLLNLMKFFEKNFNDLFRNYESIPQVRIIFTNKTLNTIIETGQLYTANPLLQEIYRKANTKPKYGVQYSSKYVNNSLINYKIIVYGYFTAGFEDEGSLCKVDDNKFEYPINVYCVNPLKDMLSDITRKSINENTKFFKNNNLVYLSPHVNNLSCNKYLSEYTYDFYNLHICRNKYDIEMHHLDPYSILESKDKTINIHYLCENSMDIVEDTEFKTLLGHYLLKDGITINLKIYSLNMVRSTISLIIYTGNDLNYKCLLNNDKPIFSEYFCEADQKKMINNVNTKFNCEFLIPDLHANQLTFHNENCLDYIPENISLYSTKIGSIL